MKSFAASEADAKASVYNSSIGLAKAALEAVNGENMFGSSGTNWTVIFIDIDAHYRNRSTLDALLPRESASKVCQESMLLKL